MEIQLQLDHGACISDLPAVSMKFFQEGMQAVTTGYDILQDRLITPAAAPTTL